MELVSKQIYLVKIFEIFSEAFGKQKAEEFVENLTKLISETRAELATKDDIELAKLELKKEIEQVKAELKIEIEKNESKLFEMDNWLACSRLHWNNRTFDKSAWIVNYILSLTSSINFTRAGSPQIFRQR